MPPLTRTPRPIPARDVSKVCGELVSIHDGQTDVQECHRRPEGRTDLQGDRCVVSERVS